MLEMILCAVLAQPIDTVILRIAPRAEEVELYHRMTHREIVGTQPWSSHRS